MAFVLLHVYYAFGEDHDIIFTEWVKLWEKVFGK